METFRTLGYQPGVGRCLHALGNMALAEKDFLAARKLYDDALTLNLSIGLRGFCRLQPLSAGCAGASAGSGQRRRLRLSAGS